MLPAKSLAQIVRLLVFVGWDQRASRAPAHHGSVPKLVGRRFAGPTLRFRHRLSDGHCYCFAFESAAGSSFRSWLSSS